MSDPVVHFEIPTENLDRAQKFYREAFGWTMDGMPGENYLLVGTTPVDENQMPTTPGRINGGMLKRTAPITSLVITVSVKDIEAALKKIEKLGGKSVRGKQPVGPSGWAAYFRDPEGNTIGLWQDARR